MREGYGGNGIALYCSTNSVQTQTDEMVEVTLKFFGGSYFKVTVL